MLTKILIRLQLFFLPKAVKNKIASIDKTWNNDIRMMTLKYLIQNDPKILALSDHEIILGTTELIYEDLMRAQGKQLPMMQRHAGPVVEQEQNIKVPASSKKVFH